MVWIIITLEGSTLKETVALNVVPPVAYLNWTALRLSLNLVQRPRYNHLVHHDKRRITGKDSFRNGHTLGFHPQSQKLEPPCTG